MIRLAPEQIDSRFPDPLVWQPLWDASKNNELWVKTTGDMWWEMMGCVPPRAQRHNSFLVGEPIKDGPDGCPMYSCFVEWQSAFYHRYMNYLDFKLLHHDMSLPKSLLEIDNETA